MRRTGTVKENARLAELRTYHILDTLQEEEYDFITQMSAQICDTPISLINFIDQSRQWFKSHYGLDFSETPREYSFCAHAMQSNEEVFLIPDSRKDPRFKDNPLVTSNPYFIYYLGIPLLSKDGIPLGTLCVIDQKPRELSDQQISTLKGLAKQLLNLLELRKSQFRLDRIEERYKVLLDHSIDAIYLLEEDGTILEVNNPACEMLGFSREERINTNITDRDINNTKLDFIRYWSKYNGYHTKLFETVHRHKNGMLVPLEINGISFVQEGKNYIYCIARDISERKKTEKRLKESEEFYRFMTEYSSELICLHEANGTYRYLSPSVKNMLGYEAEELIGTDPYFLFHPDDHEKIRQESHNANLKGKGVQNIEYRIRRKDGQYIWFNTYSEVVMEEEGNIKYITTRSRDITDRKNAEEALKQSEEKFRLLFENMNTAFALNKVITNQQGEVVDYVFEEVNPFFEKLLGVKKEDVIDKRVLEVYPTTESYWIKKFGEVALSGKSLEYINYFRESNRYYETKVYCPKPGYFAVTFTDITEKEKAEKNLREAEVRYRTFINSVSEGVYRFELTQPMDIRLPLEKQVKHLYTYTKLEECNQEFLKMYGIEEADVLGKPLSVFHGGDDVPENVAAVKKFIEAGYRVSQEETIEPDSEGNLHYYSNNTVGMIDENKHLIRFWGTQTDITKLKAYEKELIKAKETAEQKERELKEKNEKIVLQNQVYVATNEELAESYSKISEINEELHKANQELDNFVYRVSHDLRSPVASCLALIDLALQEDDPSQVRELLNMQEKSLLKQDKFIRDILDYSRNTRKEIEPVEVDLRQMIDEIISIISHDYRNTNYSFELHGDGNLVCDSMRLQMILNNLISNAFKYSIFNNNPIVQIKASLTPEVVFIHIKDNGIGIPEKDQKMVFQMFYRATTRSNGSGLGLYIVKEAIEKMQGKIELKSKVGEGTTITIQLPNLANHNLYMADS